MSQSRVRDFNSIDSQVFEPRVEKLPTGSSQSLSHSRLDTAAYFSCYRSEASKIAALFLSEIQSSPAGARKINLVYIVHEIILMTVDLGDEFVKAFGDNLRAITDSIRQGGLFSLLLQLFLATVQIFTFQLAARAEYFERFFQHAWSLGTEEILHDEIHGEASWNNFWQN